MPAKGWKSITVTEEIYDDFEKYVENHKFELSKKGVTTLSGYFSLCAYDGHTQRTNKSKKKQH